ncbi:MAG: hypothetical protein GY822_05105 [Deltaproteobacteria bacterium]|nr:hypothetical protein [Deltaproteobacteria bacterium]
MLTSVQRKQVADGWNDNAELFKERLKALTNVTDSAVKRGVITAINWLVNFPCPTQVHSDDDEAMAWVRSLHF